MKRAFEPGPELGVVSEVSLGPFADAEVGAVVEGAVVGVDVMGAGRGEASSSVFSDKFTNTATRGDGDGNCDDGIVVVAVVVDDGNDDDDDDGTVVSAVAVVATDKCRGMVSRTGARSRVDDDGCLVLLPL